MAPALKCLNWKELAIAAGQINDLLTSEPRFVDRIVVPARPKFRQGYLKNEWAIRTSGRRGECTLLVSVRTRAPYIALYEDRGPKAAHEATRSPFDLALSKWIKGRRVLELESLSRERTVILWLSGEERSRELHEERLGLVLSLIPAAPEALLVRRNDPSGTGWPILARSRVARNSDAQSGAEGSLYLPPDGSRAPTELEIRETLLESPEKYLKAVESELAREAFEARLNEAGRELRELEKNAAERARQSETAQREAEREKDWKKFGDLLKGSLGIPGARRDTKVSVMDYETGQEVEVACDPRLTPQGQVEKYYQLARRKQRRIEEARSRGENFRETAARIAGLRARSPEFGDWPGLERLERAAGIAPVSGGAAPAAPKRGRGWLGRTFVSVNGLTIWAGRSKDENLELTFKQARGNDLWLHVRGKPGSHVVIPLQAGKSAPLETLLDAATLAIYYSGGEKWGKTEVDYTFKKHVRRIKDSSEASYTHNKTLIVQPDPDRIKRLLASE